MLHRKLNMEKTCESTLNLPSHVWLRVHWRLNKCCFPDAVTLSCSAVDVFRCRFYLQRLCLLCYGPSLDSFTADGSKPVRFNARTKTSERAKRFLESMPPRWEEPDVWASALNKRAHMAMWDIIHTKQKSVHYSNFKSKDFQKYSFNRRLQLFHFFFK